MWLQSKLLTVNTSKTNYITFAFKNNKSGEDNPLTIKGKRMDKVN